MSQITVAMFDIDEIEAYRMSQARGLMEIFDELANLAVGHQRIIRRQTQPAVEDRMAIEDARLRTILRIGAAVSPECVSCSPTSKPPVEPVFFRCSSINVSRRRARSSAVCLLMSN